MNRAMWIASALLTLGLVGCDRSSKSSNTMPSSALPATASGADESTANDTSNNGVATRGTDVQGGIGGTGEESCPFRTEPDAITTVNVPDGAALVFQTSDPQEKRELKDELSQIATTQNAIESGRDGTTETGSGQNLGNSVSRGPDTEGGTEGRTGFEGPGDEEQTSGWVQSATQARAEETTQGVQLVFTTNSDVSQLRSEVRERADELNDRCTARGSTERPMGTSPGVRAPTGTTGTDTTGTGTTGRGTTGTGSRDTSGQGTGSGSATDRDTNTDDSGTTQPGRP